MDWHWIGTRLAPDWQSIDGGSAGVAELGLAKDWHPIGEASAESADIDWHSIGARLALDWCWIGKGSAESADIGLALDWYQIGTRLAKEWRRIGRGG